MIAMGEYPNPETPDEHPERKHLRRLDRIVLKVPVFLISANVLRRRPAFLDARLARAAIELLTAAAARHGWKVGRYVIMPDHVHFFCSPGELRSDLSGFVGGFKQAVTRKSWEFGSKGGLWQREFHDHLLRTWESYRAKWEYVRLNPVRKGLCEEPDNWPYQGEIELI